MIVVAPTWGQVMLLPFVLTAFLLPGWLMARRWPTPVPFVTAFLGSSAWLFLLVLALNAAGLPLHAGTLALGFTAASAALLRRWPAATPLWPRDRSIAGSVGFGWWWLVPVAAAGVSITVRAVMDPLCGYDTSFRWDYLARLFLAQRSLAGYPPMTATDFESYSWCDGIPPLIPLHNLWIYAGTGTVAPVLTGARVVAEATLLGLLVFRYARLLWGEAGGLPAIAALATSSLALWSLQTAQETGVLAITLVAMLYLLELHQRDPRITYALWAALAAAVGALSREYALAYPLLGVAVLVWRRQARAACWFAVLAAGVAAPWYVRNWAITGNPLYPQTLGGLFPGNAVHDEQMRYFRDVWSLWTNREAARQIPLVLLVLAGGVILNGAVGAVRLRARAALPAAGAALIGAIWLFLNLPQSGGGWGYASRILLPTLALLAVLSGWLGLLARRWQWVLAVPLAVLAIDAGRRSWMLPAFPFTNPVSFSFANWQVTRDFAANPALPRLWIGLQKAAAGRGIVVDHPSHHAFVTQCGGRAIPWMSPVLAPTYDERLPFDAVVTRLRASGIRFLTVTPWNPVTTKLMGAHRFWRELRQHPPSISRGPIAIYDLDHLLPP